MKIFISDHFHYTVHSLPSSLGFFEHISKDSELERIKTYLSHTSFISTNMVINHQPRVTRCIGGCDQKFSGYKGYVCIKNFTKFARRNVDLNLFKLDESPRIKTKRGNQTSVAVLFTSNN